MKPDEEGSSPAQKPSVLWGLLGILAFFLGAWFLSKPRTPSEKPINITDPDQKTSEESERCNKFSPLARQVPPSPTNCEETYERRHQKTPWWQILLQILMVIFTGGAFGAAAYYASVAAQQRDITLSAFRTDERAWVGIEPLKPKLKAPASAKFTALYAYDLYLRNSGKTVARCVEVRLPKSANQSSDAFLSHQDWIANWQDNFLLGKFQGSKGIPIIMSSPQAIAPGQIAPVPLDIYGQAPKIFPSGSQWVSSFVGRIDYIDEFNVRHWAKFCLFIERSDGSLGYCKYGNDEDHNPEIPPPIEPSCPVTKP